MKLNKQSGVALSAVVAVVVIILVVVGLGIVVNNQNQRKAKEKEQVMMEKNKMTQDDSTKNNDKMMDQGDSMMKAGSYKDYSAITLAAEQKIGQKIVLYFYAPWCPFCRAADADFKTNANRIPAGVTVLKTSYDDETALKQKYGVTYQHTFVQIDNQGSAVTKWVSGDTDLLAKNVK